MPGVSLEVTPGRDYVAGPEFSHILGYIGPQSAEEASALTGKGYQLNEPVGKDGLEARYEADLRGTIGYTAAEQDAQGRLITQIGTRDPVPGNSLQLAIDADLQQFVADTLVDSMPNHGPAGGCDHRRGRRDGPEDRRGVLAGFLPDLRQQHLRGRFAARGRTRSAAERYPDVHPPQQGAQPGGARFDLQDRDGDRRPRGGQHHAGNQLLRGLRPRDQGRERRDLPVPGLAVPQPNPGCPQSRSRGHRTSSSS